VNGRSKGPVSGQPLIASLEEWHFWFTGRDLLVDNLLARHLNGLHNRRIVDVGAGTGHYAARLQLQGAKVLCIDSQISETRKDPNLHFLQASATQSPVADQWAEAVLARDVLEHVDDVVALREWYRILEPNGLLIVLVPAFPALWSARDVRAGHLRRYRKSELGKVLRASGFVPVEMRGYQMTLLPLLYVTRRRSHRDPSGSLSAEVQVNPVINRLFGFINACEAHLARFSTPLPPIGSTLVAVARRS
jgi:SAM-dependent methyltransferase